jgi:hypothetical protein
MKGGIFLKSDSISFANIQNRLLTTQIRDVCGRVESLLSNLQIPDFLKKSGILAFTFINEVSFIILFK